MYQIASYRNHDVSVWIHGKVRRAVANLSFGGDMNGSRRKLLYFVAAAMLTSAFAFGQTAAAQQPNATVARASATSSATNALTFSQRYTRYRLRPGDVMDLNFQYSPEFNQTVTVQPDGFIALREIGDINVNGITVPDVKKAVESAYSKILAKPEIGVNLKDFEKPTFTAAGQVGKPGRYELRGDTTVIEGIALAGGFTTSSKHSQVVLVRRVDDQWSHAQLIDVKKLMASKDLGEDYHLQPGDMLIVPQNQLSKIRSFIPSSGITMLPTQF
jgi:polysaccharide biosynthesis/export protein